MTKFHFIVLSIVSISCICSCATSKVKTRDLPISEKKSISDVKEFISTNWKNTIRTHNNDSGTLIGLPKPYTVPSMKGMFQEMYYWDTYFTNLGLIADGNIAQAKNNCDNMIFLVTKYGFMPNGNRTFYLNRSQPPYLSMMVRSVYEKTRDIQWLKNCLPVLEMEYHFWMTKRISPVGLNHFSTSATDSEKGAAVSELGERLGGNFSAALHATGIEKISLGNQLLAECESGWDFNPRFKRRCEDFCPIDLNSNLYMYENNFSFFYGQLQSINQVKWAALADKRKALINKYLFNEEDGLFYDYDFINDKKSNVYSAAVFSLLWSKIATKEQAQTISSNLSKLEFDYGIAACEPGIRTYSYQWDYPNGWPCLQDLAVSGLNNYGLTEPARRIALKYVRTVSENYRKTNNLWEKYNVVDGSTTNVSNEYEMPAMLGWTAGVFVYLTEYLTKKEH